MDDKEEELGHFIVEDSVDYEDFDREVKQLYEQYQNKVKKLMEGAILPKYGSEKLDIPAGLTVYRVRNIREAIEVAM